jgi:hypothetical protein
MFTITIDKIADGEADSAVGTTVQEMPLYGIERMMGQDPTIPAEGELVEFRLLDDDGEVYYLGKLTDDDECENQSAALRWGETMAGCAWIEVKRGNAWVCEIA